MEEIIEKAYKVASFDLKIQKLVRFFIAFKLLSFAGFSIFIMNR